VDSPPPAFDDRDDALRTPAPRRPGALSFFAVVFGLFVLPGAAAQSLQPQLGLLWSEVAALLLPAVVAAVGFNLRPAPALLLSRRPSGAQAALALGVALAAFGVAVALSNLWIAFLPERVLRRFDLAPLFEGPPLARAATAVIAASVAPLCEEAAFRGFLLTALRARHAPGAAIAISTVLFAIMHVDPVRAPALLVLGATFGWLAWRSGSLWTSLIAHSVNNGIAAALAAAGDPAAVAPRADPREALAILLPAAALLAGAAALYRRATPAPPPVEEALVALDALDRSPRFDAGRLGPALRRAIMAALAAFLAIAAIGLARHR
jgi:membrane protease YdiL (CAAX protease family)